MVGFILPAQICANYAVNAAKNGVYDTASAIEHIERASNQPYSHPTYNPKGSLLDRLSMPPKIEKKDSSRVDSLAAKKIPAKESIKDSVKAKAIETIVSTVNAAQPKVIYSADKKTANSYFSNDPKISRIDILENDSIVAYDSAGKALFEKPMSRRELCSYKRMVKNIQPECNEVIMIPQQYINHITKDIELKDKNTIENIQIIDGNLIQTFDKNGKVIEKRLLSEKDIGSMNISEVREGDIINLNFDLGKNEKVLYDTLVDRNGRKTAGFNDAGFYRVICEFGKTENDIFERTSAETLYIHINDVNHSPAASKTLLSNIRISERDSVSGKLEYEDSDNDSLRFKADTSVKWVKIDSNGNFVAKPLFNAVAKDSQSFVIPYIVSDGKSKPLESRLAINVIDVNQRAGNIAVDSNDMIKIYSGESRSIVLKPIDPDSSDAKAKGLSLKFKDNNAKNTVETADTSSFEYLIGRILKEQKDTMPKVESLADPKQFISLAGDTLKVYCDSNVVSSYFKKRSIDSIAVMYDDGKEKYEVARFSVEFNYKPKTVQEIPAAKVSRRVSVSAKTQEELAKEADAEKEKIRIEGRKANMKNLRFDSLVNGAYNKNSDFDATDARIAAEYSKKFANYYVSGRYDALMKGVKTVAPMLDKHDADKFSSGRDLKRIVDYMKANFGGYNAVSLNLVMIEDLVSKIYDNAKPKTDSSAADDSAAAKIKDKSKDNSLAVFDYREAKKLIKRTRKIIENNNFQKNPKCKNLISRLDALEQTLKSRNPVLINHIGYQLSSPVRPNEWRERPAETAVTLTAEIAAAVGLYFLGKEAVDAYNKYKHEKEIKDDIDRAKQNPDNLGNGDGSPNSSFTDSAGKDRSNDPGSDSTSSDSLDSQQNLFKRLAEVGVANKRAAVKDDNSIESSAKSLASKFYPYFDLKKREFGLIFKSEF